MPYLEDGSSHLCTGIHFPVGDHATKPERVASWSAFRAGEQLQAAGLIQKEDSLAAEFLCEEPDVLQVQLNAHPIELGGEAFADYLREEGHDTHILTSDSIHEVYSKCCKALLGPSGRDLPVGHPLELYHEGGMQWQLLLHGEGLADHRVIATQGPPGGYELKTNTYGRFNFAPLQPGMWMLRAHWIEPSSQPDVDFESLWCSTTFIVPETT